MEEAATQELTQPYTDPRRLGGPPIIDQDIADIFCILHPTSPLAFEAVEFVAASTPQHILQNHGLSHILEEVECDTGLGNEPDQALGHVAGGDHEVSDLSAAPTRASPAGDIALRFSSRVHDVCLGWSFGKSPRKSDMIICDRSKAHIISAMHFCIYVTEGGVAMLEDYSTNGTWVDNILLKKKLHDKDPSYPVRRMLNAGTEISIMIADDQKRGLRFHVGFPKYENVHWKFQSKLQRYLGYVAQMKRQREAAAAMGVNMPIMLPPVSH